MKSYKLNLIPHTIFYGDAFSYGGVSDLNYSQQKDLERHISYQDYFGTLATVLSLYSQRLKNSKRNTPKGEGNYKLFEEIVDELTFLQENHCITSKKRVLILL